MSKDRTGGRHGGTYTKTFEIEETLERKVSYLVFKFGYRSKALKRALKYMVLLQSAGVTPVMMEKFNRFDLGFIWILKSVTFDGNDLKKIIELVRLDPNNPNETILAQIGQRIGKGQQIKFGNKVKRLIIYLKKVYPNEITWEE